MAYICRYSVCLLSASAMKRRGIGFVFWPILSHHELSLDQISYYAIHDWLRFLLFFSRLARPDCDQSGESGLRSDRLTISSADPIHSNVCVQPPHAPRRGDRPQPARPVPSSALAQTHRRGGGHAGRPVFPRPNQPEATLLQHQHAPCLPDSCGFLPIWGTLLWQGLPTLLRPSRSLT